MAEETKSERDERGRFVADPDAEPTAPSIGPHTVIEREPPAQRLARHEQTKVDAMGLDKHREVVGGSYGPSIARQATMYGIFVAVVLALGIGFKLLADELDQPPNTNPDVAPWTGNDIAPAPIDSPRNGKSGTSASPSP